MAEVRVVERLEDLRFADEFAAVLPRSARRDLGVVDRALDRALRGEPASGAAPQGR
ncbi:hypothetical protein [Streptomyces sp. NBC_01465]|uniref:hypothetical protein n=1 Tax=Streptomyces sp. NBC_01465 TaxID=2903878 RepID=UPI002E33A187|nr:hypothetical protein [Streptomyces sp. NBC_01465]